MNVGAWLKVDQVNIVLTTSGKGFPFARCKMAKLLRSYI